MKRVLSILSLGAFALLAANANGQQAQIGVFNRQAIVVAYYRSPQWADQLKQHQAQLDQAKKDKDKTKVKELSSWGQDAQDRAHQQLIGKAPIDDILAVIKPGIDQIEKSANLERLVPAPAADATEAKVDVTGQLLDWLKADDVTRRLISTLPPQK